MASAAFEESRFVPGRNQSETAELVMEVIRKAAGEGIQMPSNDDIAAELGLQGSSTVPGIVNRLEARGLIKVDRYQRSRRVTIVATGESTAMPKNTSPHWRQRPCNLPTPSLPAIRRKNQDITQRIMVAARREQRDFVQFLADMVWLGFEQYEAEKAEGKD